MKYIHHILFYNGGTIKPNFVEFKSDDLVPKDSNVQESMKSCIESKREFPDMLAIVSISTTLNK